MRHRLLTSQQLSRRRPQSAQPSCTRMVESNAIAYGTQDDCGGARPSLLVRKSEAHLGPVGHQAPGSSRGEEYVRHGRGLYTLPVHAVRDPGHLHAVHPATRCHVHAEPGALSPHATRQIVQRRNDHPGRCRPRIMRATRGPDTGRCSVHAGHGGDQRIERLRMDGSGSREYPDRKQRQWYRHAPHRPAPRNRYSATHSIPSESAPVARM